MLKKLSKAIFAGVVSFLSLSNLAIAENQTYQKTGSCPPGQLEDFLGTEDSRSPLKCIPAIKPSSDAGKLKLNHRPESFRGKGFAYGKYKHFEVEPSDVRSSPVVIETMVKQDMRIRVTSFGAKVSIAPKPGSENIVFKGLEPNKEYHVYKGGFSNHSTVQTDVSGAVSVSVDTTSGVSVFFQEKPSTYHLSAPGGGDCSLIGAWDSGDSKCTLSTDAYESISIDSEGLTLDCAGHSVEANSWTDIFLGADRATVQNCWAGHQTQYAGIMADGTGGHKILNNKLGSLVNPWIDVIVFEYGSGNNVIKDNTIYTTYDGIVSYFDGGGNLVENNEIIGVNEAFGAFFLGSSGHHVFLNNRWDTQAGGIFLFYSEGGHNLIKENVFTGGTGVHIASRLVSDSNNVIESNDFYDSVLVMQGTALGGFGTGPNIAGNNNQILNNKMDSTGFAGITVWAGLTNLKIIGNAISNTDNGIYFDVEINDMLIEDNIISNVDVGISSNSGLTFAGNDNRIAGNTISNAAQSSILLVKENNAIIENNIITDSAGIMIGNSNGVTLKNNKISRGIQSGLTEIATGDGCEYVMRVTTNFDAGIAINGSPNTLIEGNTIDSSYGEGIRVEPLLREILDVPEERMNANHPWHPDGMGCLWSPSSFEQPPYLTGEIQLLSSSNTVISKNVIRKNGFGGLVLRSAPDAVVTSNDVFLNDGLAVSSDEAIELSFAEYGNWWKGNCGKGLFVPGVDSNDFNVVDSFASVTPVANTKGSPVLVSCQR